MYMRHIKTSILLLLALLCGTAARTQQVVPSLTGTDFWMSFLPNYSSYSECSVMIASEESCTAHISCQMTGWETTVNIVAGRVLQVTLPDPFPELEDTVCASWHITTTAPAIVYASNFSDASHDMSAILPTSTLRNDYMVQTYGAMGDQEVSIVAPYDSTEVEIVFAEDVPNRNGQIIHHAGDTLRRMLHGGGSAFLLRAQYLDYLEDHGFSGTRIHASKPVAVFQGNSCTMVPTVSSACDHLYEQCIPTNFWGRHFVVMPTVGRTALSVDQMPAGMFIGDMVKITSREPDCIVTIEGQNVDTLATGETYTFLVANHPPDTSETNIFEYPGMDLDFYQADALPITTSTPVTVCFYITGITFGGTPGDPAAVILPPLEQGVSHAVAAVYNTPLTQNHHINIVATNEDAPLVTIDGRSIASQFTSTADGFSWARLTIVPGTHVIDADTGRFLATFYGLGECESYAYIAGMAVRSADYDVHANSHSVCMGDTVTIAVRLGEEGLGADWQVDGQAYGSGMDTVRLVFDSVGRHQVAIAITPVSDTVWEIITVHPPYFALESDSICPGDSLLWQGHTLTESGYYADTLHTVHGCDSVMAMQLTVIDIPQPSFTLETDCENYRYSILGTFVGDTTGYALEWHASPPDPALEGQPWDSLGLSPTQTTTYILSIGGRCPFDTLFTLNPIEWPVARMEVRPETPSYSHPHFQAYDRSLNADDRRWWVDGVPAGNEPVLQHTADLFADSVRLTLVALNQACADTLHQTLHINHTAAWSPNTFTPDRETNNRFFVVLNEGVAEELHVYNRNGLLVAHIVGENPQWDGTRDGTPCPQGAYVWHLRYRRDDIPKSQQTLTGTVTLLR